jgi:DnaJ like chaperone protein
MFIILLGALLGAVFGGLPGAVIGGALGYVAGNALRHWFVSNLHVAQSQLIDSTFAVMGALCKADSVVTRDELNVVEQIFGMLKLNDEQRRQAKSAFNTGKQPDFDVDVAVDQFAHLARGRAPLLQLFLQLQCMAVAADGRVDAAEHAMLVRVGRRMGLGEAVVSQLEALLRAATADAASGTAAAATDRLADSYAALGVPQDASASEIKRAYRKLISQNHPDKLAARGLPENMRPVAEERSREINAAYDLIKSARSELK